MGRASFVFVVLGLLSPQLDLFTSTTEDEVEPPQRCALCSLGYQPRPSLSRGRRLRFWIYWKTENDLLLSISSELVRNLCNPALLNYYFRKSSVQIEHPRKIRDPKINQSGAVRAVRASLFPDPAGPLVIALVTFMGDDHLYNRQNGDRAQTPTE